MSSAARTLPRRGLADRTWRYVPAADTNVALTIAEERARLAGIATADAYAERTAVRAVIAELCDEYDMPVDVPLPMPTPAPNRTRWDFTAGPRLQAGRIHTDDAVALFAVACLAAACRFGGLFG